MISNQLYNLGIFHSLSKTQSYPRNYLEIFATKPFFFLILFIACIIHSFSKNKKFLSQYSEMIFFINVQGFNVFFFFFSVLGKCLGDLFLDVQSIIAVIRKWSYFLGVNFRFQ